MIRSKTVILLRNKKKQSSNLTVWRRGFTSDELLFVETGDSEVGLLLLCLSIAGGAVEVMYTENKLYNWLEVGLTHLLSNIEKIFETWVGGRPQPRA